MAIDPVDQARHILPAAGHGPPLGRGPGRLQHPQRGGPRVAERSPPVGGRSAGRPVLKIGAEPEVPERP
eukprot:6414135-Lingulodinium_polyedra.AAC.1